MPVPTSITDLSTTAASNSPAGSDSIGNPGKIDDYFRGYGAVQRAESLNKSWERWNHTPTYINATQFSVATDLTATYTVGRRVKCTVTAGTVYGRISASAFSTVTTVTVVLDSGSLDSGLSEVMLGPENKAFPTTSAGLAALLSDETGSGAAVFGTSPTIAAPTFTGLVSRTGVAATGSQWLDINGTTTQWTYAAVKNTGGYLISGVESSAGGAVVSGSSAYSGFTGTFTATDFHLIANQAIGLTLTSDRRVYGTALHNNAGAVTGTTNQYIASGTDTRWTASPTAVTNCSALSVNRAQFTRLGNVVEGAVSVSLTVTAVAQTTFNFLIPIATAATAYFGFVVETVNVGVTGLVSYVSSNTAQATWVPTTSGAHTVEVHLRYVVS